MEPKPDGPAPAPVGTPQPVRVVVTFEAPGSATFEVSLPEVTQGQVYALATYFRELAGAVFAGELARKMQSGLVAAPAGALTGLGGRHRA